MPIQENVNLPFFSSMYEIACRHGAVIERYDPEQLILNAHAAGRRYFRVKMNAYKRQSEMTRAMEIHNVIVDGDSKHYFWEIQPTLDELLKYGRPDTVRRYGGPTEEELRRCERWDIGFHESYFDRLKRQWTAIGSLTRWTSNESKTIERRIK